MLFVFLESSVTNRMCDEEKSQNKQTKEATKTKPFESILHNNHETSFHPNQFNHASKPGSGSDRASTAAPADRS